METDDTLTLGGNIQLTGFKNIDGGSMLVIKKLVGNYVRKFSDSSQSFGSLSLTLKTVHAREKSKKFEVHAKLMDNGKPITAEVTDFNIFFAIDKSLKKVESLK